MTTPTLYLTDEDGDLAIYRGVETITVYLAADAPTPAPPNVITSTFEPGDPADYVLVCADEGVEGQYDCDGPGEALALRDAINRALVKAALAGAPACAVDVRDPDGSRAAVEAEQARRARVARDRAAVGRKP